MNRNKYGPSVAIQILKLMCISFGVKLLKWQFITGCRYMRTLGTLPGSPLLTPARKNYEKFLQYIFFFVIINRLTDSSTRFKCYSCNLAPMLAPLSQFWKDHKTVMLQSNSTQPLKIQSSNVLPFHEVKKDSVSRTEPH